MEVRCRLLISQATGTAAPIGEPKMTELRRSVNCSGLKTLSISITYGR
jgi:hypothetical protein